MPDFEARPCSVCGADVAEEVYRQRLLPAFDFPGFDQRVQICMACGFVYVSPAPSSALLSRYYSTLSNYENPQNLGRPTDEDRRKYDRARGIMLGARDGLPPGRALDIGCAVPYQLSRLKAEGWSVVGTDPSPLVAKLGRELYDVEVRTGLFAPEMFTDEPRFDLVTLSHVLEHLVAPLESLRDIRRLMSPRGTLYIEVPNLLEPAVPFGYFTFEHLNYFTPTTLTSLLSVAGFAPVTTETFSNDDGTSPFYPVIAATFRPSAEMPTVQSDHAAARGAVAEYRSSAAREEERIRALVASVVESVPPGRLALWGAGIHTNQLLTLTGMDVSRVGCVFDNDPKKQGRLLLDRPVRGLPADPSEVKRDIDAIIISSRASEDAIYRQISHLRDAGVRVYRLYANGPDLESV